MFDDRYTYLRRQLQTVFAYVEKKYGKIENAYNGMALGFDYISYEELYFSRTNINMIACIPFRNQPNKWIEADVTIYNKMKEVASKVVLVDNLDSYKVKNIEEGIYHPSKMQKRNEYMVDNAEVLISCWNEKKQGGTWNCIKYAIKQEHIKDIININPITLNIKYLK